MRSTNLNKKVINYIANGKSDIAVTLYLAVQNGEGPSKKLPKKRDNIQVGDQGADTMINGPSKTERPQSAFAVGLRSCSAFIYLYQNDSQAIDHIALYHSPSSILPIEHYPIAERYNTKNNKPENIKVVIGTPNNPGDQGIERALLKLQEQSGILPENITVYYNCGTTFGVDTFGNIGEMGGSLENYVVTLLKKAFIDWMNHAILSAPKQTKSLWQREDPSAKFIKRMDEADSLDKIMKVIEKYFKKANDKNFIKNNFCQLGVDGLNKVGKNMGFIFKQPLNLDELKQFMSVLRDQISRDSNISLEELKTPIPKEQSPSNIILG